MTDKSKNVSFFLFYTIVFVFNVAASFAHPVTPTLIVERNLNSSMFGVAMAAMLTMYFLFAPFWGRLCAYIPTKTVLLICCLGYSVGQIIFGSAVNETMVVGGRMFAGIFTGGAFTAISNYVINISGSDSDKRDRGLVMTVTLQNVGGAIGYFVGGMLGIISVEAAFLAQVLVLALSGILFFILCRNDTDYKPKADRPLSIKDTNPFSAMMNAKTFMTPVLSLIFLIVIISSVGQYAYEQCFNYFIKDQYGMTSAYNGAFKAVIAFITLFLNSTVCIYLQRKTDVNKTFIYPLLACTLLTLSILIFTGRIFFIAVYIVYSGVMVIRFPLLQSMVARRADSHNSNGMMGFYHSMNSFGGVFGSLFAGLIYAKGPYLPFVLTFISYLLASLIGFAYLFFRKKELR